MKILEICLSPGIGGLELYMVKVARFLAGHVKPAKLMVSKGSFLEKSFSEQGFKYDNLNVVTHHFPIIASLLLAKYIRKNQIDIIHVHHGKDLFLCVLARVFARRGKVIYTRQMSLTRYKHDLYHKFLYRNVDAYVVITQVLYDDAIKYLPIEKQNIHLLYYGVPKPSTDKTDCPRYFNDNGLSTGSITIAIFGRVEELKGQHLLIDAVIQLTKKGHETQVAIIGHVMDKKYFSQLQNKIKESNLEERIKYLGFHNDPVSIMSCFDVVVLATRCETFGLVLPEAMRSGTCVVGTDCGGVPEIIKHGETGLLFKPDDADDLAKKLQLLIEDKDYRMRLTNAGKLDADVRFSEEQHFDRLQNILNGLVSGNEN